MMGSPDFLLKLAVTIVGVGTAAMYMSSERGRKSVIAYNHPGEFKEGKDGHGFYGKKCDIKGHYNELDILRKVNVQPFHQYKESSPPNSNTK